MKSYAGENKKLYKQFTVNIIEDVWLLLKCLIVPVIIDLEEFKMYSDETEQMLKHYNRKTSIPANEYDSIHDKVLFQERELSSESNKILNELLDVRNWSNLMDELPESSYLLTNKKLSREVQYIEYEIDSQNPSSAGSNIAFCLWGIKKENMMAQLK